MNTVRQTARQSALHRMMTQGIAERALKTLGRAAMPPQPESVKQNARRCFVSELGFAWRHAMNAYQQDAFYRLGRQMTGKDGRPVAPFQAFFAVNLTRRDAGFADVLTVAPPSVVRPGVAGGLSLIAVVDSGRLSLTLGFDGVPADCRVQVQGFDAVLPSRTSFREKGFAPLWAGGEGAGVDLSAEFAAQFGVPKVGMKVVVRVRIVSADGFAGAWTLAEAMVGDAPSPVEEPPSLLRRVPPEGGIQNVNRAQLSSVTPLPGGRGGLPAWRNGGFPRAP